MKLNLSDIANRVRFGTHTLEILRGLVPDFPFEQVGSEDYPIPFSFTDLSGITHHMEYTMDDEVLENGTPVSLGTLFKLRYGISSEQGQQAAIAYEGSYTRKIHIDSNGGFNSAQTTYFSDWFDPPYQTDAIQVEEHTESGGITIHSLSPQGIILASKRYEPNQGLSTWGSHGVFRLHSRLLTHRHSAIVVVQDPLTAQYLNDQEVPALTLPSAEEIPYYGYSELFSGAEVYIALDQMSDSYECTMYPFAEHLMLHGIKVHVVQSHDAFSQAQVARWVAIHGKNKFDAALQEHSNPLHASEIPNKQTYNSQAASQGPKTITPAQHFTGTGFVYKLDQADTFLLCPPMRVIKGEDLLLYEGLQPDHTEEIDSVVNSAAISNIEHNQYLQPAHLLEYLNRFLRRHLYFPQPETYTLLSCWILGTYLYRGFDAYPYVHFKGVAGSGKTTILEILEKVSFNGKLLTKATVSSMTDEVHLRNATLCIDEFEDFAKSSSSHDELSRFLNGGYNYRGSHIKKYRKFSKTYSTYSPKAFGGTGGIHLDTLQSRMIAVEMQKKPDSVRIQQFVEFEPETLSAIQLIQTSGMAIPVTRADQILRFKQQPLHDIPLPLSGKVLNNRQLQLARPLLTMASLINQEFDPGSHIFQQLLTAMDGAWNTKDSAWSEAESLLRDQLLAWNKDPEFSQYRNQGNSTWFPNSMWASTRLMEHFHSKNEILKWFDNLEGVEKGRIHFPHAGKALGAAQFDWNMKICGRVFRSFFNK